MRLAPRRKFNLSPSFIFLLAFITFAVTRKIAKPNL
jgi:hypothetical protein